ncbi:hypothetical protein [Methylobacterium sp. Leaf85]|uniref:hypothetical protein n=1 Tax=Methylobacterium sp. Leaf85 TaxID=1736241 RepID=UPI000A4F9BFD|nr:hypothetical protein [Methylobacterium sp. Leaf85]
MPIDVKGDRVFVCPVPGREAEVGALRDLIEALGGTLVCADRIKLGDFEACLAAADVVVIPLCPESIADPQVAALVDAAAQAGKRVVGVWLTGCEGLSVPPSLDRVGSGAVENNGEKIRKAVFGKEPVWEEPDGSPRPPQQLPRKKKC